VVAVYNDGPSAVDSLLADLEQRLVTYVRGDRADPTLVLAEEAEANAQALWRAAQAASLDGSLPFDVVITIAGLHFFRYAALSVGRDRDDLQVALVLFAHVYRVDPERVPEHLRRLEVSDDNDELVIPENVGEVQDRLGLPAIYSQSYSSRSYPGSFPGPSIRHGPDWWTREAAVLLSRAQTDEDPEAVDRAVSLLRQAVQHTPAGHADYAERLSDLSDALRIQFERTRRPDHLDEAVEYGRAAVAATPQDDHQRAAILNHLGTVLGMRFRNRSNLVDLADIDDAIDICREAVEVVPARHPDRVLFLANLGNALGNRIGQTHNLTDLDEYIAVYRGAAEAAPPDYPHRAEILTRLDTGLRMRFLRTEDESDAAEILRIERRIG
jgi:tetratricopeptide (TPR) repeat protein